MAIRRCPYCKAIIEEGAEYCSNCGTQLLFPEDELVDEEIPGEKIVDDESEDDEEIIPPEDGMDVDSAGDEISKGQDVDKPPLKEEEVERPDDPIEEKPEIPESDVEEEKVLPEEEMNQEAKYGTDESHEFQLEEKEASEDEDESEEIEKDLDKSEEITPPLDEEPHLDAKDVEKIIQESEKDQDNSRHELLQMEDIEKAVESDELEKQEIEKFLASIKKDRGEDFIPPDQSDDLGEKEEIESPPEPIQDVDSEEKVPSTPIEHFESEEAVIEEIEKEEPKEEEIQPDDPEKEEEPPIEKIVEDVPPPPPPSSSLFEKEDLKPPSDDMPAWASRIKEEQPSPIPMKEEEKEKILHTESEEIVLDTDTADSERIPTMDTGMGLPEGVTQKDLPFQAEEVKKVEEVKPVRTRPQLRMSSWMKSRIFDVLFIAAVWLITVWIASYVMEVGFFRLITGTALSLALFYIILLAGYFFLFFFFLGETLGDHLFNPRSRSEPHRPA